MLIMIPWQLGINSKIKKENCLPKTYTEQEIPLKTYSSERVLNIPDIVFEAIVEERKKYERNKRRRINNKHTHFKDLNYICCSNYGHPRSKRFHYKCYKQLLKENIT